MQSFSLFVLFAVLLINTQVTYAATKTPQLQPKSVSCPAANGPTDRKDAYCVRAFTAQEAADPANKGKTMFKRFVEQVDGKFTCQDVDLKKAPADAGYCCNAPGKVNEVSPSPQKMWDSCTQVQFLKK
ncbi:hypothetical protein PTTG_12725 [Puccinia triticina 1-1 BBBD Race 1]|uniref:Secreted protein n=2 Tax=Puccinia triticina TaxID=208348 RepID=A0A180FX95_PUCT1|nr:uncharacterized protein PtA15_1A126 [Puccinia triticina]XP_053016344.1 uncharacterized protein PtA15_1A127 [Puccinia triticina]OAV85011.1 hypothetical protein PTTG_12725 [Puccinia triticina 1-1 BBBD Race 1]WAQ80788.1 hypothetical protein PtA15_1A126 [Puccinia triticina]WAQ80789.1 hypothetical protein PtA15_1A127 [Puccinia triticina]WAR51682.1 hypothetical protein PtB15_1B118 [Puccinia triticina]WAR51683.1 hypothetical protein PtB15_1B119 [Puccinia triticina]